MCKCNAVDSSCEHDGALASEQYRHECEVRYVVNLPTRERRRAYIEGEVVGGKPVKGIAQVRGAEAAKRLVKDVIAYFEQRKKCA